MSNSSVDHILWYTRTFVATASKIVRPNTVYRVNMFVLPDAAEGMIVKALITKDGGQHIASAIETIDSGVSHNLLLKVDFLASLFFFRQLFEQTSHGLRICACQIPGSLTDGQYQLKLDGYDLSQPQKSVFSKRGHLDFHPDFLSILVQTNRKIYKNEMKGIQNPHRDLRISINPFIWLSSFDKFLLFDFGPWSVRFRAIITQLVNLKPYSDPVTIYILASSFVYYSLCEMSMFILHHFGKRVAINHNQESRRFRHEALAVALPYHRYMFPGFIIAV